MAGHISRQAFPFLTEARNMPLVQDLFKSGKNNIEIIGEKVSRVRAINHCAILRLGRKHE